MVEHTDHYGFVILSDGDLSPEGYAFVGRDRVNMDRLIYLGAEGHRHTGEPSAVNAPTLSPDLTLDVTVGSLPPSTRVYYRHTYVDDDGIETSPSDVVWIDTPAAIAEPGAGTLEFADTGGTLPPGTFMYEFTAYKDFATLETTPGAGASITIPYNGATQTNVITLTLPAVPSGADGLNVYRKDPNGIGYRFLTSIAAGPTTFDDDGSIAKDPDRPPPTANTTQSTNSVLVELAEALPATYSWRLYRTFDQDDWGVSFLAQITGPTEDYTDDGAGTSVGEPPTSGSAPGSPDKIILTDGLEVQGILPLNMVAGLPTVWNFIAALGSANQPNGYLALDDAAHVPTENMSGIALVSAARTYR